MKNFFFAAILVTAVVGCNQSETAAPKPADASTSTETVGQASPTDAIGVAAKAVAAGEAILLDVREQNEWDVAHLDGAVLVSLSKYNDDASILDSTEGIDKSKKIYTHCAKGKRAAKVADALKKDGYDVEALEFSFEELSKNGFEISN